MANKSRKQVSFVVTLDIPDGATITDTKQYILDAVRDYKGCYRPPGSFSEDDPGDALFSLNDKTVKVSRYGRGVK